jgi:hypothetical protein
MFTNIKLRICTFFNLVDINLNLPFSISVHSSRDIEYQVPIIAFAYLPHIITFFFIYVVDRPIHLFINIYIKYAAECMMLVFFFFFFFFFINFFLILLCLNIMHYIKLYSNATWIVKKLNREPHVHIICLCPHRFSVLPVEHRCNSN